MERETKKKPLFMCLLFQHVFFFFKVTVQQLYIRKRESNKKKKSKSLYSFYLISMGFYILFLQFLPLFFFNQNTYIQSWEIYHREEIESPT